MLEGRRESACSFLRIMLLSSDGRTQEDGKQLDRISVIHQDGGKWSKLSLYSQPTKLAISPQ